MNLYGFANGDPVNFADPFGLEPEVSVACREIPSQSEEGGSSESSDGKGTPGAHCAVKVGKVVYELLPKEGVNDIGVAGDEQVARYDGAWVDVLTPEGQTDEAFAGAVVSAIMGLIVERNGVEYTPLPSRNSNAFVRDAIVRAGGYIPARVMRHVRGAPAGICGYGLVRRSVCR